MPAREAAPEWVVSFRKKIRKDVGPGWNVMPDYGRMRLQVRLPGVKTQSVNLPYPWDEEHVFDAVERIKVIARAFDEGQMDLRAAAHVGTVARTEHNIDWNGAIEAFRAGPKKRITDKTWRTAYVPVFTAALSVLRSRKAPTNGPDLCDQALKQWMPGTRQRQVMRQNLSTFLRFCVDRRQFKACWLPPTSFTGEAVNEKRIGYPLTDAQILRMIDALPNNEFSNRWRFALQLLATFGLRPEDLRYLVTRNGGTELWSTYRKSQGGTQGKRTEERRLYPLVVRDIDGSPYEWNLIQRVHLGEQLPALGGPGLAGDRLGKYLRRKPMWQSIAAEASAEGQELTPYSFRHRYSATGHARGLMPKQIADAMGHSLEVHMGSYARFMTRDLADAFDAVNAGPVRQEVMV